MPKFIRTLFITAFFMLFFMPLSGICQLTTPQWLNGIGGANSNCVSAAVKTDAQNNVYITGAFSGTVDFDPSAGINNLTAVGENDVYVAKYNTTGSLIWAVSMGGSNSDGASSLTVDKDGNPIITGQYNSPDFDANPGPGSAIFSSKGERDVFVVKLNANGGLVWAKTVGGAGDDYGGRISVDSQGNMVTTMSFHATVDVDGNIFTSQGGFNGLIIKFSPNGSLLWAINLSDTTECQVGYGDFDHEDNFIVCGTFKGNVNFNPLGQASFLNGNDEATFIAKYTSGGLLTWVNPIYGRVVENSNNLCISSKNDIFLAGTTGSALTINLQIVQAGDGNVFLAKYTSAGNFKDVKIFAGAAAATATIFNYGIVCSSDDNIYLSGYFTGSVDFNASPQQDNYLTYRGGRDFFLAKYDEDLNYKLAFAGGSTDCDSSTGRNLAVDSNNDLIFTGNFCSTVNFSASNCAPREFTAKGNIDTFLGKYKQNEPIPGGRIDSFTLPQQVGTTVIDQKKLKITVTVPAGSNIKALIPAIAYNSVLTLSPASRTVQNFTWPVIYTLSIPCYALNYVVEVVYSDVITEKQDTVCNGQTSELIGGTFSTEPDSYVWQFLQNNVWIDISGTTNIADYTTPTLNNETTSNIILNFRRKTTKGDIITYDSFYGITVLPPISNNTIATPVNDKICGSADLDVIVGSQPFGGNGVYTYRWQISSNGTDFAVIDGAVSQNYDPPVVSDTVYYRRLTTTSICVQERSSNIIHYYIQQPPLPPVTRNDTVCAGSKATLLANAVADIGVNWYSSATGGGSIYTGNTFITPPVNENTVFYAEAINGDCTSLIRTAASVVMAQPLRAPMVSVGQVTLNSITFNWDAVTDATGYEVSVNGAAFASVANALTYTAGPLVVNQTVTLSVRATGILNCNLGNASATVSGTAITSGVNQIFVPNMFSPNGDGSNDVLYVRSQGIKSMVFQVYSQWGEMIYRSVSQTSGWDGSYKGNTMPVGVYMYYVEAVMLDGSKVNKKGSVTLLH
ncbi:MAG: T9SS type B sorting domain-containing protein [Sphingobacteriaceae bacterium]|nr:MAG: T9SS type B sorting domain-containing protein [Sphingobacteriaceae bacterium]